MADLATLLLGGVLGAVVAKLVRFPMWPLTGAIIGSASAHILFDLADGLPTWLSIGAQVLIGTAVGSRADLTVLRRFASMLLPAALAVITIVGAAVGVGVVLAATGLVEPIVASLGTMPGGAGEMVATATSLEANGSLVAGMHVVRLLVVLVSVPLLLATVRRWRPPPSPDDPPDHPSTDPK